MLVFNKCEVSGQQHAVGKKSQYWIEEMGWTYMTTLIITKDGPELTKRVHYECPDHAMDFANSLEKA